MSRLHKNRIAVPKLFVTNNSRKHFSSRIFPKNLGWFVFENNKTTKTSSSIKTKEFDKSKWHIAPWRSQSDPFGCFNHKNLAILTSHSVDLKVVMIYCLGLNREKKPFKKVGLEKSFEKNPTKVLFYKKSPFLCYKIVKELELNNLQAMLSRPRVKVSYHFLSLALRGAVKEPNGDNKMIAQLPGTKNVKRYVNCHDDRSLICSAQRNLKDNN